MKLSYGQNLFIGVVEATKMHVEILNPKEAKSFQITGLSILAVSITLINTFLISTKLILITHSHQFIAAPDIEEDYL
jgi:hypothetical protein